MAKLYQALIRPFVKRYENDDIRIRKKARLLVPTALAIGLFGLVLCALMSATGAFAVAGFLIGLTVFCAIVLILIARGRYSLASSMFCYGLFAVMFAAIKFDAYKTVYECYVFGTLGSFLLLTAALIAVSRLVVYVITGLNLAAIAVLYLADALPLDGGTVTALAAQSLGTSSLLVLVGGLFAAITVRLQRTLVDESANTATVAKRQFEATTMAIQKAQESSWKIGSRLAEAGEALSRAARELSEIASEESVGVKALDDALVAGAASDATVASGQERVGAALGEYSSKVLDASAAISQMMRSLKEIGDAANERRAGVSDLAALARDGDERIAEVGRSIDGIVKAAARMDEMNALIGDVANRTNLLGMNASIEAAHAGAAGRGFGVVAGEIRKLSEEAADSSRAISKLLTDTRDAVEKASSAGAETSQFFGRMSDEIQRVSATLGELLVRLGEVSAGTAGISGTVEGFRSLADSAGKAADQATLAMRESSARSATAREVAARLRTGAERVNVACGELLVHAEAIHNLGRENAARMEELKNTLAAPASLAAADAST